MVSGRSRSAVSGSFAGAQKSWPAEILRELQSIAQAHDDLRQEILKLTGRTLIAEAAPGIEKGRDPRGRIEAPRRNASHTGSLAELLFAANHSACAMNALACFRFHLGHLELLSLATLGKAVLP